MVIGIMPLGSVKCVTRGSTRTQPTSPIVSHARKGRTKTKRVRPLVMIALRGRTKTRRVNLPALCKVAKTAIGSAGPGGRGKLIGVYHAWRAQSTARLQSATRPEMSAGDVQWVRSRPRRWHPMTCVKVAQLERIPRRPVLPGARTARPGNQLDLGTAPASTPVRAVELRGGQFPPLRCWRRASRRWTSTPARVVWATVCTRIARKRKRRRTHGHDGVLIFKGTCDTEPDKSATLTEWGSVTLALDNTPTRP
jgi:hypothetical protein